MPSWKAIPKMLHLPAPHAPSSEWDALLNEVEGLLNSATPLTSEKFIALARIWSTSVSALTEWQTQLAKMKQSRVAHRPDEEPASLEAIAGLQKRYSRLAAIQGRCLVFARTAFPHSPNHSNPDPLGDTALAIKQKENQRATNP
jgi:hypothetical protein